MQFVTCEEIAISGELTRNRSETYYRPQLRNDGEKVDIM